MNTIFGAGKIRHKISGCVLAIGVFDGVHRGHQALIKKAVQRARQIGSQTVVMTFYPHPAHILRPRGRISFLIPLKRRLKLIESLGVDVCVVIKFSKAFARLSPRQFVKRYILRFIHPVEIFVGEDFHFGRDKTGNIALLKQIGEEDSFKVHGVALVKRGKDVISSTRIRQLIASGKIYRAAQWMGRPVSILGRVEKGKGRGRSLGFPTANINPSREVVPLCGVYMVEAVLGQKTYRGMANVGLRPSFQDKDKRVNVEVHLFRFHRNICHRMMEVKFFKRIRKEKIFSSKEKLVSQLKKDRQVIKKIFARSFR